MPTIDELDPALAAADTDAIPASQGGVLRRISRAQLLAGMQEEITLPAGLLGRSDGLGAPQPIAVGTGLALSGSVLSALPVGTLTGATNLSAGLATAAGTTAARSLAALLADAVGPESFGAVGDGITDDTGAFAAAIGSGRPVRLGPRTYRIDGQWTITQPNTVLLGTPGLSVLKRGSQTGNGAWISVQAPGFRADGVTFDANRAAVSMDSWGVLLTAACTSSDLHRCEFLNASGAVLGSGLVLLASDPEQTRHVIRDCRFAGNAAHGLWVQACAGVQVSNCRAHDNAKYGFNIDFNDAAQVQRVRLAQVTGNRAWANQRGIAVDNFNVPNTDPPVWGNAFPDAVGIVVAGNICHDNTIYGIAAAGRALLIQGNLLSDNGTMGNSGAGILANVASSRVAANTITGTALYGIDCGGAIDSDISQNAILGHGYGINCGGSTNLRVAANQLAEFTIFGICATNVETDALGQNFGIACSNLAITSNRIAMSGTGEGVWLRDGPRNCVVADNDFTGRGVAQCLRAETDSVLVRGNRHAFTARFIVNPIVGANDDAISAHADSFGAAPLRSGVVIANNTITESQGIAALGCKSVLITGNVMRRIMGTGIRVLAPAVVDPQGQTPQFALRITNNIVADVFQRPEPNSRTAVQFYIWIEGGARNAGGGAAAPGEPAVGTGAVTSLYGTGSGTFYAGDSTNPAVAAPAGFWNEISDNYLVRTLPAVSAVSDWGYGAEGLWVGDNGDGSGFYNGAVSEARLNIMGMLINPSFRNSRISGNTIQTSGPHAILFNTNTYSPVTTRDMDYDGLTIEGNRLVDFGTAAIQGPPNGAHRVLVRNNEIDGDPLFRAASRSTGGTWSSATGLVGLLLSGYSGFTVSDNAFRNVATAVRQVGAVKNTVTANTLHGDPVAVGFSASNRGVGTMEPGGAGWLHVVETSDPADALYGRIKTAPVVSAAAMPTTGTYVAGHFVAASAPVTANRQTILGWARLTTGSGHVAGTDWAAVHGVDGAALSSPKVSVFTASGTWTKDPSASQVEVWGGGGAGGNGGVTATATVVSGGGGGGGGGGKRRALFRAVDLPASIAVTMGAAGARGVGNGVAGGQGGTSSFGTLLRAFGGGGGAGGSTTAAGGGGGAGDNNPGGNASGATAGAAGGTFGAAGGASGAAGGSERVGGGGGGGVAVGGGGQAGGYAAEAGGGGGSGAGISAANATFAGGATPLFNTSGSNAGGVNPGGAGSAPAAFAYGQPASMGGPGGSSSTTVAGGAGASGQPPTGGGGGGGAARTGQNGGLGGLGGTGLVIVCEW